METTAFVPLPPDAPIDVAPAQAATGVAASSATISWKPGPWAHRADVYFGTSTTPPLLASNVSVSPNSTKTCTLSALAAGTTYSWRVVSKTIANKTASGQTYRFTTAGTTTPPAPSPLEIVLYAAEASTRVGSWVVESDPTAAGTRKLRNPNAGAAKLVTPLASPPSYVEMTFTAEAGRPNRSWYGNDSVQVQFSGSVTQSGTAVYRIGAATSTEYNLESCSGCGLSNWGNGRQRLGNRRARTGDLLAALGTQKLRIQPREDGLSIDQIVLSAQRYLTSSPGLTKNDATILPK